MSNNNKRRGTQFETAVVNYLKEHGKDAIRIALAHKDLGDVHSGKFCIQCKNHKQMKLSEWIRETEIQKMESGKEFGVLVVRKRMDTNIGNSYVVMRLRDFVEVM